MVPAGNAMVDEPTSTLSIAPVQSPATACKAVTCCDARPGTGRPARIRTTRTGVAVSADKATAIRTSWPPPSPWAPSISIITGTTWPGAPNDLQGFDEGKRAEGNEERPDPVEDRQRFGLERTLQERRVDHEELERHRGEDGHDELRVRQWPDGPQRLPRGPDREDEEELEEHKCREGDGPSADDVGLAREFPEEDPQCAHGQNHRDDDDEEQNVPGQHPFFRIARRSGHQVGRVRIDPERDRREAIRHEVDPEELNRGEERQELRIRQGERRDEHDQDFSGVPGTEGSEEITH